MPRRSTDMHITLILVHLSSSKEKTVLDHVRLTIFFPKNSRSPLCVHCPFNEHVLHAEITMTKYKYKN